MPVVSRRQHHDGTKVIGHGALSVGVVSETHQAAVHSDGARVVIAGRDRQLLAMVKPAISGEPSVVSSPERAADWTGKRSVC